MKRLSPLFALLLSAVPAIAQLTPLSEAEQQSRDIKFKKSSPDSADVLLDQGRELLKSRDFAGALAKLQQAADSTQKDPVQHAKALAALAGAHAESARYFDFKDNAVKAKDEATEALRLDPKSPTALRELGHAQIALMNPKEAVKSLDTAVTQAPKDCEAVLLRGIARALSGDYKGALADHNEAIKLCPDNADAYSDRGVDEACLNDFAPAQADYQKSISLDAKGPVPPYDLGLAFFEGGKFVDAEKNQQTAFNLEPRLAQAEAGMAVSQFSQNRLDDARKAYAEAVKADPRLDKAAADIKIPFTVDCSPKHSAAFDKMRAALAKH